MLLVDFETFKYNWCMVAYDLTNQKKITIVDDVDQLRRFYRRYKDDLIVGYNIRNFDRYVLQGILCGFNPYDITQFIIEQDRKGYEYSSMLNKFPLNIYDVMPPIPVSLKVLEGFLGADIRETTVPFNIQRPLTKAEMDEVLFYCDHDVQMTGEVLNNKKSLDDFNAQWGLLHLFNLPLSDMGRTKAQLAAKILGAKKPRRPREDDIDFLIPDTIKVEKYKYVVDWFLEMQREANEMKAEVGLDEALKWMYKQQLKTTIAGVETVFAWGGIHASVTNHQEDGYFFDIDASSYYPAIMIEYGLLSRNVQDPQKFVTIRDQRLEFKRAGDQRANSLKLLINAVYGASKDKYNPLVDCRQANSVCVHGQLLLLSLIEELEPYVDLRAANTDGITIKLRANNDEEADEQWKIVERVCRRWERRTRIQLEAHQYKRIIVRDVNNYVMVDIDGKIKSKGAVVKKLHDLDYDLPIVNRAVVNFLVYGTPVEQTVMECNDLRDFQKIYKVSSKYAFATHNGRQLTEKVFRVFASNNWSDTALFKCKTEGATEEKFASCPDHCFIDNGEVLGKAVPDRLDRQWYIDLAEKRIKEFLYGK